MQSTTRDQTDHAQPLLLPTEIHALTLPPTEDGPGDVVSLILVPCFLRDEHQHFGLAKYNGRWREFERRDDETKDEFIRRVADTLSDSDEAANS